MKLRIPRQTAVTCGPHPDLMARQCSAHSVNLNTGDHKVLMCFTNSNYSDVLLPRGLRAVIANSWQPDPIHLVACTRASQPCRVKRNVNFSDRELVELSPDCQTVFVPTKSRLQADGLDRITLHYHGKYDSSAREGGQPRSLGEPRTPRSRSPAKGGRSPKRSRREPAKKK